MIEAPHETLGTRDLEKGMRPSAASTFRTIVLNAVVLLLVFNSEGLVRWAQKLPSNSANAWLAERAADWNRMMHVPPAEVLDGVRKLLKVDGS